MKKILLFATFALLSTGIAMANEDGKNKKKHKKECCSKEKKDCCKKKVKEVKA